jgi:ATP-dependent Lhr-like helicase
MAGFDRLHPHLQHAIVNDLGWRSLRPVQDLTIDAVLDGANCVVLAPTAGGKTEASIFPVLSRILAEEPPPVAALYVCPIRALLNNQEERIGSYARMVGLSAFKWHGDVSDVRKRAFRAAPSHVLMTTPESLEVMMISQRTDARALLAGLQTVVIDEVHAFAGDDRGAHLAALLERIAMFVGRDVQRIGLSATVGNPQVIGQWMMGSSARRFRLVDPPKGPPARELTVDSCGGVDEAAGRIAQLGRGKKSLVFVESRARAERVAQAMGGSGVLVFIHHSSVSREEREHAELQFANGENTAIVCTATMELGIDVGDLDQVLQVDAPATVASMLQRVGRTGRREGKRANGTFFCTSPETVLQAVAMARLANRGWVEDVRPAEHAVHILAHQVMALSLQEGGLSRHRVLDWGARGVSVWRHRRRRAGRAGRHDGEPGDPLRGGRPAQPRPPRREALRPQELLRAVRHLHLAAGAARAGRARRDRSHPGRLRPGPRRAQGPAVLSPGRPRLGGARPRLVARHHGGQAGARRRACRTGSGRRACCRWRCVRRCARRSRPRTWMASP